MPDKPGVRDAVRGVVETWWYETARGDGLEVYGYSSSFSYRPGDELDLHVHTTAEHYQVTLERDGAERLTVYESGPLPGHAFTTPSDASTSGCGWPVTISIPISSDWPAGAYIVTIHAGAADGQTARHQHWIAVRPQRRDPAAILLVCATATWTAYNAWGGSSHYEGISGPLGNAPAARLSTQRPWSRGLASMPAGAERNAHTYDIPIGWVPRYSGKEWAYGAGYPKYAASAGWAMYEAHFVRWAERRGYRVHLATQHDLHHDPGLLDGYRVVALVGHDEYWSWQMRDSIDAFVAAGGHVARFAGNFYWQIRLEQEGQVQVCHKYRARHDDPVRDHADRRYLLTSSWDDPLVGRPAAKTMGLTATRGMYVRCFGAAPRASGGYTVYRPAHWALVGCDLYYGDVVGAAANVFGYEVDGLAYTMREGLPYATGEDGIDPDQVEIIAMNVATMLEEDHGNDGAVLFCGDEEAAFVAELLHGTATPETIDRVSRGSGMMAVYQHGAGMVFNAGSVEWVNGLRLADPFVERITDNVLRRFLASP